MPWTKHADLPPPTRLSRVDPPLTDDERASIDEWRAALDAELGPQLAYPADAAQFVHAHADKYPTGHRLDGRWSQWHETHYVWDHPDLPVRVDVLIRPKRQAWRWNAWEVFPDGPERLWDAGFCPTLRGAMSTAIDAINRYAAGFAAANTTDPTKE